MAEFHLWRNPLRLTAVTDNEESAKKPDSMALLTVVLDSM